MRGEEPPDRRATGGAWEGDGGRASRRPGGGAATRLRPSARGVPDRRGIGLSCHADEGGTSRRQRGCQANRFRSCTLAERTLGGPELDYCQLSRARCEPVGRAIELPAGEWRHAEAAIRQRDVAPVT